MFRLDSVSDPRTNEHKIRHWRCGRIVMRAGKLIEIQQRLLCGNVSVAEVWLQAKFGRRDDDCCWLDYHQPLGMPSFLTLDYIRTGTLASYKTLIGACQILDEIARIRSTAAVVAHVTNRNISDRLLLRNGWERHMERWKGRHWIRRYYDGYPTSRINRLLDTASDPAGIVDSTGKLRPATAATQDTLTPPPLSPPPLSPPPLSRPNQTSSTHSAT